MPPSDWDLAPKCVYGPNFISYLIGESPILSAASPALKKESSSSCSSCFSFLRWVWVFLERIRILSGIQFTTHFIEFFVVETKRFVGSSLMFFW